MLLQKFDLPSRKTWLRVFAWIGGTLILSLIEFGLLVFEKLAEGVTWLVGQIRKPCKQIRHLVDNLPYGGVPISETERIADLERVGSEWLQDNQLQLFDFGELRDNPDKFPHLRIIGKTGVGKTTLAQWLMELLGERQFVITPKKKPADWTGQEVYGYPFNYQEIEEKLKQVHSLMYSRYREMDEGREPDMLNFVVDEWRLINQNLDTANELLKDIITVSRDARIRLIAIAQGENVKTWGLDGEGQLEECFTTIRLGAFAIEHCKKLRNRYRAGSEDYNHYSQMLEKLESGQEYCCMVENQLALIPDLSFFKAAKVNNTHLGSTFTQTSYQTANQDYPIQLNQYEQLILKWGRNNSGKILTARDAQSGIYIFKSIPAEDIRNYFYNLASKNFGTVMGEGHKLAWVYY